MAGAIWPHLSSDLRERLTRTLTGMRILKGLELKPPRGKLRLAQVYRQHVLHSYTGRSVAILQARRSSAGGSSWIGEAVKVASAMTAVGSGPPT